MPRIRPYPRPRMLAPVHEARSRHRAKVDKRDYARFMAAHGLSDETSSENDSPLSSPTNSEDLRGRLNVDKNGPGGPLTANLQPTRGAHPRRSPHNF